MKIFWQLCRNTTDTSAWSAMFTAWYPPVAFACLWGVPSAYHTVGNVARTLLAEGNTGVWLVGSPPLTITGAQRMCIVVRARGGGVRARGGGRAYTM